MQWDTPADSANGSHGTVYLEFPSIPGFDGATPTFHSGGYQKDGANRFIVREVTTYQSAFQLSVARFLFALSAGLPFGIVLHSIWWAFVLKGEKRERVAAFPPQGTGLPQTFYPNPIAEWIFALITLGIGALVAGCLAGASLLDGFISSSMTITVYVVLAIAAAAALVIAYFTGRNVLTVCVAAPGIAYTRGRTDQQWLNAAWSEILSIVEKSRTYRGNTTYWIEIQFHDKRKTLKIQKSIERYAELRSLLFSSNAVTGGG